jgi:hypothetical protein
VSMKKPMAATAMAVRAKKRRSGGIKKWEVFVVSNRTWVWSK